MTSTWATAAALSGLAVGGACVVQQHLQELASGKPAEAAGGKAAKSQASFESVVKEAETIVKTLGSVVSCSDVAQAKGERALIVDVRDGPLDETIPGAINISLGQMPFKADCDSGYADVQITAHKSKPVVLTCDGGAQAMLAGKLLCEYGYSDVKVIEGGNAAWKAASLPTTGSQKAAARAVTEQKVAAAKVRAAKAQELAAKAKLRSEAALMRGAAQMEQIKQLQNK